MEASTQDKILDSAAECFGRFGYKKTSIERVAEHAGVGKGTVYLYCESKEDLFYQSVHRELRQWISDLSKKIDPRRPADQLMVELAALDLEFVERRPLVKDLLFGMFHGLLPEWVSASKSSESSGSATSSSYWSSEFARRCLLPRSTSRPRLGCFKTCRFPARS